MSDLSQAIALVTGGAQGIGRSCVEHLLAAGARVTIADLKSSVGAQTQQELAVEFPGKILFVTCDVTDPREFEDAIKSTIQEFGNVNIIVNNAGICNEPDDVWRKMIRINIDGVVTGTKLGFQYMSKENGGSGGTIVNVASISTFTPWEAIPVYSGTKAFVNQFSRSYGRPIHYECSGVKVVSINPGVTETPIIQNAALVNDSEKLRELMDETVKLLISQKADNVGRGLITVLQNAENGSMWVIHNGEDAREITMQFNNI